MKGFIVIIYIQEHISDSEEIIKYSMFRWRFFEIHKVMRSFMMGFMFTNYYHYTTDSLKQSISIIKKQFTLLIYGPKKLL